MTNTSIAIVYFAFMVVTLVFFLITYTGSNRKRPVAKAYLFIAVMMLCWEACEILYCLTQNAALARYLYDLKIPFVTLAATSTLPFTLYFYRLDRYLTKIAYILIYLIPAVTTLFALTSPLHNLLRQELIITTDPLLHIEHNVRGIWFWVHSAQVYLTVLGVLILIIRQHYKAPRSMRAASNFLLFGMTLTLVLSMVSVSNIITAPFDITLIGMCVALIFLYIGTAMSERAGFLSLARDEVFNHITEIVLVLYPDGTIADRNRAAKIWLSTMQIEHMTSFSKMLSALTTRGAIVEETPDTGGFDLCMDDGARSVFHFSESHILGEDGEKKGSIFIIGNVTKNKALVNRLAETAEIDALTGLQNRYGFEQACEALDIPANYPLAVLYGDLNNLKAVNDTLGHQQGDSLIITAASLLHRACPPGGRLFRVGGDEFVMLVPTFTKQLAEERAREIQRLFDTCKYLSPQPSIAIGCAVKEYPEQSLADIVKEADSLMYMQKRSSKSSLANIRDKSIE
ncbi:diguanylate cyclase [Eubacteriales bacterium OttesenSCG-928-K08]|nr:diguanylate cyclase [Eubacteriales bacterium OttesenSCG-928-K08]